MSTAADLFGQVLADFEERIAGDMGRAVEYTLDEARRRAPVDSGDFRESLQPFGPGAQPAGSLAKGERRRAVTVEQAMAGWRPGMDCGVVSQSPYAVEVARGQGSADPHFILDAGEQAVRRVASGGDR